MDTNNKHRIIAALLVGFCSFMLSSKNKLCFAKAQLTVDENVFVTSSQYGKSELKWDAVQKLSRTKWAVLC
jgi:hypothetical protein